MYAYRMSQGTNECYDLKGLPKSTYEWNIAIVI